MFDPEPYIKIYGEQHRQVITDCLIYLEENLPKWGAIFNQQEVDEYVGYILERISK